MVVHSWLIKVYRKESYIFYISLFIFHTNVTFFIILAIETCSLSCEGEVGSATLAAESLTPA